MEKDFDKWNEKKKALHSQSDDFYFREREVWWCRTGVNVGFEEDGKSEEFTRPVLILKKFSKDVFVGIPLSTTKRDGKYYYHFKFIGLESVALLSQIRLFDTRRLGDKMGRLPRGVFEEIRKLIKDLL